MTGRHSFKSETKTVFIYGEQDFMSVVGLDHVRWQLAFEREKRRVMKIMKKVIFSCSFSDWRSLSLEFVARDML